MVQTKRSQSSTMDVPTCTDCLWQFIPDGQCSPSHCPECDGDEFAEMPDRDDSQEVKFAVSVLKAMLQTVWSSKWDHEGRMAKTIIAAMNGLRR